MTEAFVLGGVRTPFARYGSSLSHIRTDELLGMTMTGACERVGVGLEFQQPARHRDGALHLAPASEGSRQHLQTVRRDRCKPHARVVALHTEAVAVVFDLVEPLGRCRHHLARVGRQHSKFIGRR